MNNFIGSLKKILERLNKKENEKSDKNIYVKNIDAAEIDKKIDYILLALDKAVFEAREGMSKNNFDIVMHGVMLEIAFAFCFMREELEGQKKLELNKNINNFLDYLGKKFRERLKYEK